jgi:hypothetical protein
MKLMSLTVPVLIVALTVVAVWGMGMLAVKTSAISTQASLDLLRLHLRVARLHEELLDHSKRALSSHAAKLAADGGPVLRGLGEPLAAPATSAAAAASAEPESALQPWPEEEPSAARGEVLEEGLRKARPTLNRLAGQLGQALPPR